MKETRRWTKDEEQVLLSQVRANPQNLLRAFRETAQLIERTECACRFHWYEELNKESYCFFTLGTKSINLNRKIVSPKTTDNTEGISHSKWKRIMAILCE